MAPGTFGAIGALLNATGLPGAAAMFAVAFALGTVQSTGKLAEVLKNPQATREEKGKAVYDTVTNGFQFLGGCVFGLDVLGLGDKNPAAANNAQQWVLTACAGMAGLQGLWEAGEAVVDTRTYLTRQGTFFTPRGSKSVPAIDDASAPLMLGEGVEPATGSGAV